MNYLAHILLSGNETDVIIGNFMADGVKGAHYKSYDKGVVKGILLHRHIDSFTDSHPVVNRSKHRIFDKYRHYAAVIVDVYYDHFLAAQWDRYSKENLLDFTLSFYNLAKRNNALLPDRIEFMLRYMARDNWLYAYRELEGIEKALTGMSRRTSFESGMEKAVHDLRDNYEVFNGDFEEFFPQLQASVNDWVTNYKHKE